MNKFEDLANNDVCIRDLKQLGREGGASAYLDSGEILRRFFRNSHNRTKWNFGCEKMSIWNDQRA